MHRGRNADARETTIASYEFSRRDLCEIVIFGGDPEDRHSRCTALGKTACEFDRGESFVNRVEGSRKEAGLLARNDRQTIGVAQPLDVAECRLTRAPVPVHGLERIAERGAINFVSCQDFGSALGQLMMKADGRRIETTER